jgi:molybdopterin molybdotransferase
VLHCGDAQAFRCVEKFARLPQLQRYNALPKYQYKGYLTLAKNSQALDLEEAINQLTAELVFDKSHETVSLALSLGRGLAEDVFAPIDMPPFPASAMDGYAMRRRDFANDQVYTEVGRSLAGHPYGGAVGHNECIRVFTGAVVPDDCDLVVLQEQLDSNWMDQAASNEVKFLPHTPGESYVRPRGHDAHRGDQIAKIGDRVTPFLLGALQSYGISQVSVRSALKIGVFSTGDELVSSQTPPDSLKPGQIYDSNRTTVMAMLNDPLFAVTDLGCLADDAEQTQTLIKAATQNFDILITSGGVSVGDADFVTAAIEALGHLKFWKLNLKPGKPMAVGLIDGCTVFGLPGNPVSTVVTLLLVAKPVMMHLLGVIEPSVIKLSAQLTEPISHTPGRIEYQRGTLTSHDDDLQVSHTGDQSSNRLRSFYAANCLIEIAKEARDLPAGSQVRVIPFWGLLDRA